MIGGVSSRRREAVQANWFASTHKDSEAISMLMSEEQEVRPGTTALIDLHEVERGYPPAGDWPEEISVDVSGVSFVARMG